MLFLAFLILIFANIINHTKGISKDIKVTFLYLIYLWILLLFAFRGTTVPDTDNYIKYYYSPDKGSQLELFYSLLCKFSFSLGLSFTEFLLVFQILLFSLWFSVSKKYFEDVHLPFLAFFSFMGIYNFGIIIRAGLGLCICYLAITYLIYNRSLKGYIVYYATILVSTFFQESMVVFCILPLFFFKQFSYRFLFVVLLISLILPLTNFQVLIIKILEFFIKLFSVNKFLSYTQVHVKYGFHGVYSLTMIKYLLMAVLFLWLRIKIVKKVEVYNIFLNIYVAGVFLISLTYFIDAGNRLAYLLFFFEFVLVGLVFENSKLSKKIVLICTLALCVLNYLNLISAVPSMINY